MDLLDAMAAAVRAVRERWEETRQEAWLSDLAEREMAEDFMDCWAHQELDPARLEPMVNEALVRLNRDQ